MRSFLKSLVWQASVAPMILWGLAIVTEVALRLFSHHLPIEILEFCFAGALFLTFSVAHTPNISEFLRRTSPTILDFWRTNVLIIVTPLVFNAWIFSIIATFIHPGWSSDPNLNWPLVFWIAIAIIILCSTFQGVSAEGRRQPRPLMLLISIPALFAVFALVAFAYTIAPALAVLIATVIIWWGAIFASPLLSKTMQKPRRLRVGWIGTFLIFVGIVATSAIDLAITRDSTNHFIGNVPEQTHWAFGDVEKAQNASDWYHWYKNRQGDLSAKELIQALTVLERVCTEVSSDQISALLCEVPVFDDSDSTLSIGRQHWTQDDVLMLLKSNENFPVLEGIMAARHLVPLPSDVVSILKELQTSAGRTGALATVTLSARSKVVSNGLYLGLVSPKAAR